MAAGTSGPSKTGIGLSVLFGSSSEDLNAEALQDSYVCEAGGQEFLAILARHPLMMAMVMMAMARQMFRLERTIESLAREPVDSRLAAYLQTFRAHPKSSPTVSSCLR